MSEGSSDEGSPGWEFVKNEDLVETSDGESVEVIGFSCPEESDTEDVLQGEEVQVVDDVPENIQTFDLVEVKKEAVLPKNLSNVWESFVVIMAITSVGLAVTAFLFHSEDVNLDSWTSESAEFSVALEELQKYQKINIALNKEINQLKKVIQHLEIQVSKLEVQNPDVYDVKKDGNLDLEVDYEESKNGPVVFVENHSDTKNLNENLLNLTSNFKLRSDSLKKGLKISIDDLNNQVAHNILKTSWDIRNKLHQNLFGHFDLLKECGKSEIKKEPEISETIDAITKEVAFTWMKFYEEVLEKKFDGILHEITHNIENSNSIFNDFLTQVNSSSQVKRKTERTEKPKKDKRSQKAPKRYKEKGEGKKHKLKEEKQYKNLKEGKQHKNLKEEKQHKNLKEEKQHKKFEEEKQRKKIKEKKEKTKSKREDGKKYNHPVKNEKNYKREKTSSKEKKKENQTFYFDKKKWKYVKFSGKENKTRLNRPKYYKLNKNCFNKTFNTKKEGWWFTDLGKHRSGIRWEESRSEWQFDRARNRRLRKF